MELLIYKTNPPTSFSLKTWRVCPFQKITNDLYGGFCGICLRGGAPCQQIGVAIKEGIDINARSGVYFLRTSLEGNSENTTWLFYNTIIEIDTTFRVLKSDLDLRPIYHQKDETTMAHLHLGLLAYWLVNTVRHQLKKQGIHSGWREIVRTMNTQKAVTTLAQNNHEEVIMIRRYSEPNQSVRSLYDALKYKYAPFVKRKSVVHKSELENCQFIEQ